MGGLFSGRAHPRNGADRFVASLGLTALLFSLERVEVDRLRRSHRTLGTGATVWKIGDDTIRIFLADAGEF